MKVLFIATYEGMSGASHSLVRLVKHLEEEGVKSIVIIPKSGPLEKKLKNENIKYKVVRLFNWVTPINKKSSFKERLTWIIKNYINVIQEYKLARIIRFESIDILHINAITANWGFKAAKKTKTPVVWHIREFLEEDLNKTFRNSKKSLLQLNQANCVIAISNSVKKKYVNLINKPKLIKVYNGIDVNKLQYNTSKLNKTETILTLVGRIVSSKGHLDAIYALSEVIKNHNNIKLRFVGSEGDELFVNKLKTEIQSLGISNYVEFLGHVDDVSSIWRETDIALVCSKAEAFGRVTVEAMMSGALLIGANTEGTAEIISNEYGLLYEQGNYKDLALKINDALNDKERMNEIVIKAQKYAISNFTSKNNAELIHEIYINLIKVQR